MLITTEEKVAVMQAFVDGKQIEYRNVKCKNWTELITKHPVWDWGNHVYRIQPPKPRTFWINDYGHSQYVHETKDKADKAAHGCVYHRELIEVQEVL